MGRRLATLLVVSALAAAACGGSGDDAEPDAGGDAADGPTVAVEAVDFAFEPTELTAEPGTSVTIEVTNSGSVTHTFTATDLTVDLTVEPGGTGTALVEIPDEDATVDFVCTIHPDQMKGTIVVGAGGEGARSGRGSGKGDDSGDSGDSGSDDYDY